MMAKRSVAAFRQRERALSEFDGIHRGDREAECRQRVGRLANRDGAVLQPFEKGALRFERDAVDLVEQDHFRFGERPNRSSSRRSRG